MRQIWERRRELHGLLDAGAAQRDQTPRRSLLSADRKKGPKLRGRMKELGQRGGKRRRMKAGDGGRTAAE